MTFDPKIHNRRSIRLSAYDYSKTGMYFVTACTQNHECLFGNVIEGKMRLSEIGRVVESIWNEISLHFPQVELDEFVIMPNHVHGIIGIGTSQKIGAGRKIAPSFSTLPSSMTVASSAPALGKIMRSFKSRSAIAANKLPGRTSKPLWQRNYWERVIRHDEELHDIREYISNNPLQWHLDQLYR